MSDDDHDQHLEDLDDDPGDDLDDEQLVAVLASYLVPMSRRESCARARQAKAAKRQQRLQESV